MRNVRLNEILLLDGTVQNAGVLESVCKEVQKCAICLMAAAAVSMPQWGNLPAFALDKNPAYSELGVLISGPPVKDPRALLRYALPISNKPIKEVQKSLEDISENLKLPGAKAIDPAERVSMFGRTMSSIFLGSPTYVM